jgi:glycosyltransferase EpsF
MNTLSVFPLYAAKRARVKIRIAHTHATFGKGEGARNLSKKILRKFSKKYATNFIAPERPSGEWLFGKDAYENGEIFILKNAIDASKFKFDTNARDEVLENLGVKNRFVIGHN